MVIMERDSRRVRGEDQSLWPPDGVLAKDRWRRGRIHPPMAPLAAKVVDKVLGALRASRASLRAAFRELSRSMRDDVAQLRSQGAGSWNP